MPTSDLGFVGETDFPLLYSSGPFETTLSLAEKAKKVSARSIVCVLDTRHFAFGVELSERKGRARRFTYATGLNLVATYRAACFVEGMTVVDRENLADAYHVMRAVPPSDGSEWFASVRTAVPPRLPLALLLLQDAGLVFSHKPIRRLIREGVLPMCEQLEWAGFRGEQTHAQRKAQREQRKAREAKAFEPYKDILAVFCECNAKTVATHPESKRMVRAHVLDFLRRGVTDAEIMAGAALYLYRRFDVFHTAYVLKQLDGLTGLRQQFEWRCQALDEAVNFAYAYTQRCGNGIRCGQVQLRQQILDLSRKWQSLPVMEL
jgi:hypothetical protein